MVKAQSEDNTDLMSKNLHIPKHGSIQKKRNQKFKQTPTGKVTLINGSKAHDSSMKQQDLEKQKSTIPQKSPGKSKEQKKSDSSNKKSPKNEPQKKDPSKSEEDDSASDEDINEGIVLEEQISVQESDSSEDNEVSDESDESESGEVNMTDIFGTSLADDTEEDDEDYEEDETETKEGLKDVLIKKGVKMFQGLKQDDKSSEPNKNSEKTDSNSSGTDEDEDEDDSMEDEEEKGDDDDESEEETDEEDDDEDEDSEDEEEGNESTLGLKALLGNSLAEDDDDEDFVEPGEEEDDDTDEDDDEDEEEEEKNNSTPENSQGGANDSLEELKHDKRTIFVGNLPKEVTKKQLKKLFKKYGRIETIRLRGIVAKTINMPKKVAAITKKLHPKLKSVHAYIKYDSEESATAALDMNGKIFEGNYLRVDTVYQSDEKYDTKKSVFLGNLQFKIDENTVRKHFEDCGEIESVRIVRDNKTGIGKGFGYINFKSGDAVALALEMNGTKILNREVRVKPCGEHEKKKDKHGKRSLSGEKNGASPKKLKNNAEAAVSTHNKDNATKRISNKQEKRASPQQTNVYQGQKADGKKKKGVSKFEKKKKVLAEKLMAKPKKPAN